MNINFLISDFNNDWNTFKKWHIANDTDFRLKVEFGNGLKEKARELISCPNDLLLCTSGYVKAMERAYIILK